MLTDGYLPIVAEQMLEQLRGGGGGGGGGPSLDAQLGGESPTDEWSP
jgi:hypothetical protein